MGRMKERIIDYIPDDSGRMPGRQIPVIKCDCGAELECWDGWANECPRCHVEYNGYGQRLNPRHLWENDY